MCYICTQLRLTSLTPGQNLVFDGKYIINHLIYQIIKYLIKYRAMLGMNLSGYSVINELYERLLNVAKVCEKNLGLSTEERAVHVYYKLEM